MSTISLTYVINIKIEVIESISTVILSNLY
jgi:hypothetical protein